MVDRQFIPNCRKKRLYQLQMEIFFLPNDILSTKNNISLLYCLAGKDRINKVVGIISQKKIKTFRTDNIRKIKIKQKCFNIMISHFAARKSNLYSTLNSQIIKQIEHVDFQKKELHICGNRIDNIQSLLAINLNCIEVLSLYKNRINRITCLKKLSIFTLRELCLQSNPINELNSLTRAKMNQNIMKQLIFQLQYFQNPSGQDLSINVKLNSKMIENLQANSDQRIRQPKIEQMLNRRCQSIIFLQHLNQN